MEWELERAKIKNLILFEGFHFEELAIRLFSLQSRWNPVYKRYLELLGVHSGEVNRIDQIPFLPIQFFKNHLVKTGDFQPEAIFKSSGTTGQLRSRHVIRELLWYKQISSICFNEAFGPKTMNLCLHFAVLPSYASNPDSSLLYMLNDFIDSSGGGFYHFNVPELEQALAQISSNSILILWGVSHALYNTVIHFDPQYQIHIIETGGMKGKEREMTREELHLKIMHNLGVKEVASEYGMTELLSQAYARSHGLFKPGSTLKILPRCLADPLSGESFGQTAALNVIDLANLDSCAFIATEDLGKVYADGTFEVLGRMDNSDIRGCNLLVSGT